MRYANTYHALADFGRELLEKKTLTQALPLISLYAKNVIKAERCSIFINDRYKETFWTTLSDGVEKIVIPSDKGLVGATLKERKPIMTNDPYNHPNFLSDVDKQTGFVTKNVITAPIFSSKREILGVFQLLNKEGGFDNEDIKFMIFFSHYISGFLELTNEYLNKENE
jgi:signal transduction protein with GAF and PtsI domain